MTSIDSTAAIARDSLGRHFLWAILEMNTRMKLGKRSPIGLKSNPKRNTLPKTRTNGRSRRPGVLSALRAQEALRDRKDKTRPTAAKERLTKNGK
jgi:hypothetical protein